MNPGDGSLFGSSAASLGTSVKDGGEGCKPAGNTWLFSVPPVQRTGNPL